MPKFFVTWTQAVILESQATVTAESLADVLAEDDPGLTVIHRQSVADEVSDRVVWEVRDENGLVVFDAFDPSDDDDDADDPVVSPETAAALSGVLAAGTSLWSVVSGNVVDGVVLHGPFASFDAATVFAREFFPDGDALVTLLENPNDHDSGSGSDWSGFEKISLGEDGDR